MDGSTMPTAETGAASRRSAALIPCLRIVDGLHAGASTRLALSDMLVLGASDDCDVILSDEGIAPHHCILMRQGRKFSLRAVDAPVKVRGETQAPGASVNLAPGCRVAIGGAAFTIERISAEAAAAEAGEKPAPRGSLLRRHRWHAAASFGAVLVLGLGVTVFQLRAQPAPAAPSADEVASHAVSSLGLQEVTTGRNEAGQVEVRGVVPDAHSEAELRQDLAAHHVAAAMAVRSGTDIAHDVVEVLRLSGIAAQAQYGGDGVVSVHGHLGPQPALAAVIQSRSMHEIQGLKRVVAYNEDHPGQSVASVAPEGKRIVSAVAAEDPYVVTADGSHYYLGAELPQGGRLSGVAADSVLIEREGKIDRVKPAGARIGG